MDTVTTAVTPLPVSTSVSKEIKQTDDSITLKTKSANNNHHHVLPITPTSEIDSIKEKKNLASDPEQVETTISLSAETDNSTDLTNSTTRNQQNVENKESIEEENKIIKETELKIIAKRLFDEDFVSIKPEEYLQFLASDDSESSKICYYYMKFFKWSPNLLKSIRMLCTKLYLKGESQEIDRILSVFTKSWLSQYPNNLFYTKNFEQIYIIIYSLILLNTALHNSELNKKSRINQSDFIKNTFTTFCQQNPKFQKNLSIKQRIAIETELSQNYESLIKDELYLKRKSSITTITKTNSNEAGSFEEYGVSHATTDNNDLSRQVSNSSIWSTDTGRRSSLAMKRFTSTSSEVSNFTNVSNSTQRVGLARALVGQQQQQQHQSRMAELYKQQLIPSSNKHQSLTSQISTPILRQRHSFDHTKLNKRSSRSSIISTTSNYQSDDLSVLSFDTAHFIEDHNYNSEQHRGMENFDIDNYQDQFDLQLELQGSPYLKEGLLKYKVLNNNTEEEEKAEQPKKYLFFRSTPSLNRSQIINKLHESFVVVSKGEISFYSFDPKLIKKYKKSNDSANQKNEVGDGNWLNNAVKIGCYNLCSTFAQLEKNTNQSNNNNLMNEKVFWSLTFPKTSKKTNKKFVFEAGTKEIALEFINTCNFWASKITAIPTLEESISSIEYGWTNLDSIINSQNKDQFKRLRISKWEPIIKGIYLSNFVMNDEFNNQKNGIMKQFIRTSNYYNQLKTLYNDFIKLKSKFLTNLSKSEFNCSNYNRILQNFDLKIDEYRLEMNKYKNYLIILGYGLNLRFNLQDEKFKQEKALEQEQEKYEDQLELKFDDNYEDENIDTIDEDEIVRNEIEKLFTSINISKVIPTYKNTLVKSPKISNFTSPINQLIESTQQDNGFNNGRLNNIQEDEDAEL